MIKGEQMTLDFSNQDTLCGRTFPGHYHQTVEKISESSSKRSAKLSMSKFQFLDLRGGGLTQEQSWATDIPLRGELWTHNIGECPKDVVESHLSQILEVAPHPTYYLTARACDGVIIRAEKRWKKNFPEVLSNALEEQSEWLKEHPNAIKEATEWYEEHKEEILRNYEKVNAIGYDGYNQCLTEKSATITSGASDIKHTNGVLVLNDQGGGVMNVSSNITGTLRSQIKGHPPIALDRASFNQGKNGQYDIGVDETGIAFTVVAKGPGAGKE